jgi:ribosomal protein S18 acetylase RimI-like enzyme
VDLARRPARDGDQAFLFSLFGQSRATEFAGLSLDGPALDSLLRMQFDAQERSHRDQHPNADFDVVLVDGEPGGRLTVDRRDDAIELVDIALAPAYRGGGIGTRLLGDLQDEARKSGQSIRLHVARSNPAARLYERLGFTVIAADQVYAQMEWRPGSEL